MMRAEALRPEEPELLYLPDAAGMERAQVTQYMRWLRTERGVELETWDELQAWSVDRLEDFWRSVWDYFSVVTHTPYDEVLAARTMPGARWFTGATVNYAEQSLGRPGDADRVAVIAHSQTRGPVQLTFADLAEQVRRARAGLKALGVQRGDAVAAYLPNCPETLVAFLATVSLGAVWSACAPEFGVISVIDRFGQIEPKVLLAVAGYMYGDKAVDRRSEVAEIRTGIPSVQHLVHVPYGPLGLGDSVSWEDVVADTDEPMAFEPVPFDHPLFVLFSSGTTGRPKAIVHCHGGILLEHLKNHAFHWDLGPGSRLLWFTTTAWMMWNSLVSALLVGSSIVMIDGNPLYPDLREQWRLAEATGATLMGASPGYLMACRAEGVRPAEEFELSSLRQLGAAGSPFPKEGFRWVLEQFGSRVLLNVGSGGTDVCTGLVQGSPLQPVWAGEMSGAGLGVDVKAFDEHGNAVVGDVGELVITSPMPSMPVGLWGDHDGSRLRAAYFEDYPGAFRFGDWCRFSSVGSCLITGRSDATLNRGGVRLGTAEFYRVLQDVEEIRDSVVVHLESPDGGLGELILFVVPREGVEVDSELRRTLTRRLRTALSPRHVPDAIVEVRAVPYSRTGKKLEVPVKKILRGADADAVASPGALMDASALDAFVAFARARGRGVNEPVTRAAVVGTGVIGAGWAALFLARGLDVAAHDPAPGAEGRLREAVDAAWPTLARLGLADGASPERLRFTDLDSAVADAQFVQESGPEREDLKRPLLATLDASTPAGVVIASSSSGMLPSHLQAMASYHPERVLVGHPFHPSYLIPLVEVVPGRQSDPACIDQAVAFYSRIGKRPILVRREVPGHVTNRLQAALWREAYSLVERGVASVADIDAAIVNGPGLRWAILGPLVGQHLSGGAGGIAHTLEHLGPPAQAWMDDLGTPQLTPELVALLVAGVDDELVSTDQIQMVRQRDELLVQILEQKRLHTQLS